MQLHNEENVNKPLKYTIYPLSYMSYQLHDILPYDDKCAKLYTHICVCMLLYNYITISKNLRFFSSILYKKVLTDTAMSL